MSFKKILRSELSITEIAQVYGVSRQTVYSWKNGVLPAPRTYTERVARGITAALMKLLPLDLPAGGPARKKAVERLAARMQKLPPAPAK